MYNIIPWNCTWVNALTLVTFQHWKTAMWARSWETQTLCMHQSYCTSCVRVAKSFSLRRLTAELSTTHNTEVSRMTKHTLFSDRHHTWGHKNLDYFVFPRISIISSHKSNVAKTYLRMGNYSERCRTCHHCAMQIIWQSKPSGCAIWRSDWWPFNHPVNTVSVVHWVDSLPIKSLSYKW